MRYRKKPIEIEAWEITLDNWRELEKLAPDKIFGVGNWRHVNDVQGLNVRTLEGLMFGEIGDYLIKGVKGEFYPCKPDIFKLSYDPVEPLAR